MKKLLSFLLLSTLTMSACSVETSPIDETPIDDSTDEIVRTDNVFVFEGLEVGQQYGDLQVEEISAFEDQTASEGNFIANFSGTTELSGDYEYYDANHEFWPDQGCFIAKGESLKGLPVYTWFKDDSEKKFCFENNDLALEELGKVNKKNVTVTIEGYTANIIEGEAVDWADLKEVE